ncbi:MAG: hypothetical protein AAF636_12950 [Pseudomonadota bacterium]
MFATDDALFVFLLVLAALPGLPLEIAEAVRVSGAKPVPWLLRFILASLVPAFVSGMVSASASSLRINVGQGWQAVHPSGFSWRRPQGTLPVPRAVFDGSAALVAFGL